MFLAIDVGNTQTTLGLICPEGTVVQHWRLKTCQADTADELMVHVAQFFSVSGHNLADVHDAAVACVVPVLVHAWRHALLRLGLSCLIIATGDDSPMPVALPNPRQVGADRIANACEASRLYGSPCIVVDFGTATNIDVVDQRGTFVGGVIAPGIMLSAEALFARASKLSGITIEAPKKAIGDSSEAALQSGIVLGAAAMADGLVARIQAELNAYGCPVIATGGLARTVASEATCFTTVDSDLTLRGIHHIWKQSRA